jgi:hypothetical protein
MAKDRFRAPADWSDAQVEEAVWMLRLGKTCAHVADCMRVFDEVVLRMGWALRAAGVDVQGLVVAAQPKRVVPSVPPPAVRPPRLPAHIVRERPREKVLAAS